PVRGLGERRGGRLASGCTSDRVGAPRRLGDRGLVVLLVAAQSSYAELSSPTKSRSAAICLRRRVSRVLAAGDTRGDSLFRWMAFRRMVRSSCHRVMSLRPTAGSSCPRKRARNAKAPPHSVTGPAVGVDSHSAKAAEPAGVI